jgi:myosin heavy subunit
MKQPNIVSCFVILANTDTRYQTVVLILSPSNDCKQVFFRAGVLGQMEEFRDERLSRIMSWMQAWARGYLTRKTFKKLQEQRLALTVVQRSLRRYLKLRTWPWWKLWQKVKPLLNASRVEDQIAVSIFVFRVN